MKIIKKIFILLVLLSFYPTILSAEEYCGFNDYTIAFDNNEYKKEIIILDANSNLILDVVDSYDKKITFNFPLNVSNLKLIINEYINGEKITEIRELSITDCGYTQNVENYENTSEINVNLEENKIILTENNEEIATVKIAPINGTLKKLTKKDGKYTYELQENKIYNIEVINKNQEKKYYELNVEKENNYITLRNINGLSVNDFGFKISYKWLIISGILIVIYILLQIYYKKALNKERKYYKFLKKRRGDYEK